MRSHGRSLAAALFVFFIVSLPVGPVWPDQWQTSFEMATARARTEKRPILLEFHAVWCGYCAQMKKEIFETPTFFRKAAGFVLLSIDGEKNEPVSDRYRVGGYPTVLFLDANGVEISRLRGYVSPSRFFAAMSSAYEDRDMEGLRLKAVADSPDGFRANYEAGAYYANAQEFGKARDYYWRAYRSGAPDQDRTGQMRRKALYNLAALSMRLNEYELSASLWDAFVRTHVLANTEMARARYWRAVSRLRGKGSGHDREIREDLEYAVEHLPFSHDREEAAQLLKSLKK